MHDTVKVFNNIRPRPTSGFNTQPEVCVGENIIFTDASTGNGGTITEHWWDNGNGTFVLGTATSTISFATNGTKTIRHYIVTDQGCISDTTTKTIYVNALPVPSFTVSLPRCEDKQVTFNSTATAIDGVINNYEWNFGDGSATITSATNVPQNHVYADTGAYTVTLKVTTDKGCTTIAATQVVRVYANPIVNFSMPEICLNDPLAQFFDSSKIIDNTEAQFTYLWNFGDPNASISNPNTSTIKNPTHVYTAAANYNMSLEVTSNNGCKTKKDTVFTVNGATPAANFNVQNASNLCSNKSVTIQNTSTVNFGSVTYLEIYWDWTGNPLQKTVDQNPTPNKLYTYNYPIFGTPGTKVYTIRLVAYSGAISGPCVNAITKTVTILASPTLTFANVPDVCQEKPGFIISQAAETSGFPGTGVYSGTGIVGGQFNPAIAGAGTHIIKYTYTGTNGCLDTITNSITVNPTPNANAGPDITVLEGGNGMLLGTTSSTNVTYQWTPSTWLSNTSILQPITTPTDDITYVLDVISNKGCKATDRMNVRVLKGPVIPNAFSPNGDGINDTWTIEYLDTYPGAIVEVYNIYGQKIFRSVGYSTPWDGKYNGKVLPIGTYYYIIEPKNGRKPYTGYVGIVR
jgi:gliding motility-associated-like protein